MSAFGGALGTVSGVTSELPLAADDPFDAAVDLTLEGRLEDALEAFNALHASGDDSAHLYYNLGVVHYRLGQLGAAREAFTHAARDPEMTDAAHYNLGLVAMAGDDPETAAGWFHEVEETASNPDLRRLASTALRRLIAQQQRRRGSLTLTRGSDSDVILAAGSLAEVPSSVHDGYWGAIATWADRALEDRAELGYHLGAIVDRYDTVDEADLGVYEAGLEWRGPATLDFTTSLTTVSDSAYEQSIQLRSVTPVFVGESVILSLELNATGSLAAHRRAQGLDGTQLAAGATAESSFAGGRWNFSYRHIWNDREAPNLSPEQHAAGFRVRWPVATLGFRAWGRWVRADFPTGRDDNLFNVGAGLDWSLSPRWDLVADLSRQENDSSEPAFRYGSTQVAGGLRMRF